ncbi:hypothetical protein RCOM_0233200 [Ricinus communis]|uniref:C2H2-type domain-containing protein n=1 Tax=Ricinus communis TaxID=3988 RepID=B9T424_RICCO|nr:hypothetical protein RCOM_0233200 [Ricinus communis]|eukprot:XP_025015539.1 zinc finger protein 10-like [Ricinus communis]
MEVNHSTIEKSDEQVIWRSSGDQQWSVATTLVRSYTCSFCKKGFSNAQALGGHMNIHRKDRAKLREAFDDENLLSLNSMNPADDPHNHQVSEYKNLPLEYSEEGSCIPKTPYTLSTRDDARTTHTNKEETKIINRVDGEEDKKPRQLIRESTD